MTQRASPKLRALPVQFIELPNVLILKRGGTELKLEGDGASDAAQLIFSAAQNSITSQKISALFSPASRPIVDKLVQTFLAKGFLVTDASGTGRPRKKETPQDVFFWHFGQQTSSFVQSLNRTSLTIVGINHLSKQMVTALLDSGIKNFKVVDHPLLRHESLFSKNGALKDKEWSGSFKKPIPFTTWMKKLSASSPQCLVVTSDFGPSPVFREMNQLSQEHGLVLLPVILHNLVGSVGPLIFPGETACYACLQLRQNSHQDNAAVRRAIEDQSYEGQGVVGFHPSMVGMLAHQAVLELVKFHGSLVPAQSVGHVLEMDFLSSRLSVRKVLKVPRCPVCSSMSQHGSTMAQKTLFALDGELTP